jgi:hypothetical protein
VSIRVLALLLLATTISRANQLQAQEAEHRFTGVSSVRELRSGRILVVDGPDNQVWSIDFEGKPARKVGRTGRGPGEYSSPFALLAVGNDSTLLVDLGTRRWLMLVGDSIVETLPADHPAIRVTGGFVEAADSLSGLLGAVAVPARVGRVEYTTADSLELLRVDLRTGSKQRLVSLRRRPMVITTKRVSADGRMLEGRTDASTPLAAEEAAVVLPDGTLLVARLDPFRVDRRSRNGQWILGEPLPVQLTPFNRREHADYVRRNPHARQLDLSRFPRVIPPFVQGSRALVPVPGGLLLVRRPLSADERGTRYTVIGRNNELVGEIRYPAGQRIALVSAAYLYTVETDDDGFEIIRRQPRSGLLSP